MTSAVCSWSLARAIDARLLHGEPGKVPLLQYGGARAIRDDGVERGAKSFLELRLTLWHDDAEDVGDEDAGQLLGGLARAPRRRCGMVDAVRSRVPALGYDSALILQRSGGPLSAASRRGQTGGIVRMPSLATEPS